MTRSNRLAVAAVAILLVLPLMVVAWGGMLAVPSAVDAETFCLFGETSHAAEVYTAAFALTIAFSGVALVVLMVSLVQRLRWRVTLSPLAWLGVILLAELLVALAIGPQPCGNGIGGF